MRKFKRVFVGGMLAMSLLPATIAYGAEQENLNEDENGFYLVVEDSERAVPNDSVLMSRAALDWQWGLYVDGGWVGGYDVSAVSSATSSVDYLYAKAEMFFADGSQKSNEKTVRNSDSCEAAFYDGSTADRLRSTNTFKSTHKFQHTGYTPATKYVTRNLADI